MPLPSGLQEFGRLPSGLGGGLPSSLARHQTPQEQVPADVLEFLQNYSGPGAESFGWGDAAKLGAKAAFANIIPGAGPLILAESIIGSQQPQDDPEFEILFGGELEKANRGKEQGVISGEFGKNWTRVMPWEEDFPRQNTPDSNTQEYYRHNETGEIVSKNQAYQMTGEDVQPRMDEFSGWEEGTDLVNFANVADEFGYGVRAYDFGRDVGNPELGANLGQVVNTYLQNKISQLNQLPGINAADVFAKKPGVLNIRAEDMDQGLPGLLESINQHINTNYGDLLQQASPQYGAQQEYGYPFRMPSGLGG